MYNPMSGASTSEYDPSPLNLQINSQTLDPRLSAEHELEEPGQSSKLDPRQALSASSALALLSHGQESQNVPWSSPAPDE